jgi:hypothetical protein
MDFRAEDSESLLMLPVQSWPHFDQERCITCDSTTGMGTKKMKAMLKLMRGAVGLILILSTSLISVAQQPAAESVRLDRLVGLAKLWAAVKYFHPSQG